MSAARPLAGVPAALPPAVFRRLWWALLVLALLPLARVEEASQALSDGDASRARDIVRRVAPAAVRRISRRVLTDRPLRADVDRLVRHYARSLAESARNGDAVGVSALLASDPGRTFLLLDAAVGDLG